MGPRGIWLGDAHMCVCPVCVLHHAFLCLLPCMFACVKLWVWASVCVCECESLAWGVMPQGAWTASEGPVCPQSLTICALLVVIKVSNLEVSWGLAKRGQKMSLRRSSRWAAVTIFTYLYTLIVFASLPWHWGSRTVVREAMGRERGKRTQKKTQLRIGFKFKWTNLHWADWERATKKHMYKSETCKQ